MIDKIVTLENLNKLFNFLKGLFGRNKRKENNNNEVDEAFDTGNFDDINNRLS